MIGANERKKIGPFKIPNSMFRQKLIPYFELYWEGNKVKLNA